MKNIGEEIKKIIDLRGLKRRDLAHFLDMTEANVSKIYNKESIDVSLLERISKFLKVPITYFFETENCASQNANVAGDQSLAVAGDGNFFSGESISKGDTTRGGEDNILSEKVKMLEKLLEEKERVIEEKERLIKILMEKR